MKDFEESKRRDDLLIEVMRAQQKVLARLADEGKIHAKGVVRGLPDVDACRNGHEYTVANTHFTAEGRRVCRTCAAARRRRYRENRRDRIKTAVEEFHQQLVRDEMRKANELMYDFRNQKNYEGEKP